MSKKHCFQHLSRFSFSHFSIIFQPDGRASQISGPLSSRSETKLKGWSLNTREVRCQLPPTLRDQIRLPTGTCLLPHFPLFTFTRNPVIPAANHSSDLMHMCRRICNFIGLLCFSIPRNPGSVVLVVMRNSEGKGIPHLWLEYCLGSPKQTFSSPGVN